MTPGARVHAAIEILDEIAAKAPGAAGRGGAPADAVVNNFIRARRFIGSKDRAFILNLVYGILRHRSQLDWWMARVREGAHRGVFTLNGRSRAIAALAILEGWTADNIGRAFHDRFTQGEVTEWEYRQAEALSGRSIEHPDQPDTVKYNCPEWILPALRERFGDDLVDELPALNKPAPVDLRANILKGDRAAAQAALKKEGVNAEPTELSPWGLRAGGRPNLPVTEAFKKGVIEIQDEGSQVAAMLVGAQPGMRIVDFCAGAGGKSLALAAMLGNKGHIVACDVSEPRLAAATKRLRRAGAHNVEPRHLTSERDAWVKRQRGKYDRVLIDAPCSGTGTWRRNPDARWTLSEKDIVELRELQKRILDSASRLVRPGGRLIYVTCSLIPEENQRQAEAFTAAHADFSLLPISKIWPEISAAPPPSADPYLQLSPARHGTDGFFAAVFERTAAVAAVTDAAEE